MTVQADFAATLVDEWVRAGVRDAVVAPGSRSAPLATALLAERRVRVHVRLDERSAAFYALGIALESGRPAAVVTTSGTASVEVHAAVVEADLAGVPLLVCTADRPPELHGVGSPQTVDQVGAFGGAVRFAWSFGVPDDAGRASWRSLAARLVAEAAHGPRGPGPVHANLAFAEPLVGAPDSPPRGRVDGRPWHDEVTGPAAPEVTVERLLEVVAGVERGLLIAGSGAAGVEPEHGREAVLGLARALGWPVLADPLAWPRERFGRPHVVVAAADQILRSELARERLAPDVVVHLGAPHASRVLGSWSADLAAGGTRHILVDPYGRHQDPDRVAALVVRADPGRLATLAAERLDPRDPSAGPSAWLTRWEGAESVAQRVIDAVVGAHPGLTEPGVARALFALVPGGATLVASSSMPVRDVEWFAAPREGAPRLLANRGANGIDGVVSTVLGVAASRRGRRRRPGDPAVAATVGLLGDLAFFHDLSGLVRGDLEDVPDAALVVVDNGGGGIFSFLPYAGDLSEETFERAFATPQAQAVGSAARGLGLPVTEVATAGELAGAVGERLAGGGVGVVVARTDRHANVLAHREIERAVTDGVDRLLEA